MIEIDSTFYRIPSKNTIASWIRKTPQDFIFSAKMNRDITHPRSYDLDISKLEVYYDHLSEFGKKLRMVLLQFPVRFRRTEKALSYLLRMIDASKEIFNGNLLIEVRNESWFDEEVKKELNSRSVSFVETNIYPMRPEYTQNEEIQYFRMLGDRKIIPDDQLGEISLNKDEEIKELANRLRHLSADMIFAVFNNRFTGNAITSAESLTAVLKHLEVDVKGLERPCRDKDTKSLDSFF